MKRDKANAVARVAADIRATTATRRAVEAERLLAESAGQQQSLPLAILVVSLLVTTFKAAPTGVQVAEGKLTVFWGQVRLYMPINRPASTAFKCEVRDGAGSRYSFPVRTSGGIRRRHLRVLAGFTRQASGSG